MRRPASPEPPPIGVHRDDPRLAGLIERCTFPAEGTSVTCAVSGGADSTALALLAVASGLQVTVVHVDHGLRPDSIHESAQVATLARRLGCAFEPRRVTVPSGPNLEARAREARYGVLPPDVMTGHTADDQAETMVLQLLRGAGLTGLAGMRPGVRRPLLGLRRHETEALCRAFDLAVIHDQMNLDPRFTRVRVRREVLPLLDDVAQRDVTAVLARQAGFWRDDDDLLASLAEAIDPTDAVALSRAPVALARRAVRRWLADPTPPSAAEVERVLQVARGDYVACELEGGRRVARTHQRLRVEATRISVDATQTPRQVGPGNHAPELHLDPER